MDIRLGVWLGPDGYGDTPAEEKERTDMLVSLCRDFNFRLFKMDLMLTQLSPEKQDAFIRAMQAFNRCLLLAPELYGNPWFLRDDEYPRLARLFNIHRQYRDILIKGMVLAEDQYGKNAVSRGDDNRRLITLNNISWEPVTYKISLDKSIGLKDPGPVNMIQYHPFEKLICTGHNKPASINLESLL